jgi:antitoxin component of MazEF toxin-antitoxin module
MKSAIRKMGNSHGVIIPKPLLAEIGAKPGDKVDLKAEKGKIVIAPVKRDPRAVLGQDIADASLVGHIGVRVDVLRHERSRRRGRWR